MGAATDLLNEGLAAAAGECGVLGCGLGGAGRKRMWPVSEIISRRCMALMAL